MLYRHLADLVLVLHFAFVVFAVLGALLVLRWQRLVWIHVPLALWAVVVELTGWMCPLTPLEKSLRNTGGAAGYPGGFIEHYLLPVIYPPGLTREVQIVLGLALLAINALVYRAVWRRWRRSRA